ncbi:MAG TPA: GerMN domain-containing protein [Spirochaetota bacterium]|nr:GerMN domain-containing protein [Spirochaetota bacterium]
MEKKSKKKPTAKSASKKSAKAPSSQSSGGSNGPFYVLVIIILITIIILLLNKFYENGKFTIPYAKNATEKSDTVKEKNDSTKNTSSEKLTSADSEKDKKKEDKKPDNEIKKPDEIIPAADKEVSLYFLKLDEKSEKIYLSTVKRKVPEKQILSLTLEQLIKGPTAYEQGKGYITAVPSHLKIRSINIKGKTAEIDFNGVIEEGAAGDILLKRIQQIVNTATQFESVDSIIIKINGQRRKTIGGDGYSIGGPLRR